MPSRAVTRSWWSCAVALLAVAVLGVAGHAGTVPHDGTVPGAAGQAESGTVPRDGTVPAEFNRDVLPILRQHCYECHGATKAKGSLRLDLRERALRGGTTGPAIVPGDSEHSLLVRRLLGLDHEDRMPLDKEPLAEAQIATIRRWIDAGADWPVTAGDAAARAGGADTDRASAPRDAAPATHWAYIVPKRPPLPPVRQEAWVRMPIDRFVLARLEAESLQPSPEASREALLRRVTLDLIGLPPTLDEMDAFLADTRPDAYERVVDRLLASPHYGERWARPWLDLARYADSHGYEKDALRTMWRYRDWVIEALNKDMPFDQFTIEQLAGDMLPSPTPDQRIATGFHRNTLLNQEGGIDVEEARWETLVDRVNTTGTVWLGTTIGCAQCHDHKYDPFTERDYYRMLAFFDNVEYTVFGEQGSDHYIVEPQLELPTAEQAARRAELQKRLDALKKRLEAPSRTADALQVAWERSMLASESDWTPLAPKSARSTAGTTLTIGPDHSILASGPAPADEAYVIIAALPPGPVTGLRLEALPDPSLPQGGPGRDYYGNFALTGITAVRTGGTVPTGTVPTVVGTVPKNGTVPTAAPTAPTALTFTTAKDDDHVWSNDAAQLLKPPDTSGRSRDLPPGWSIDATRDDGRLRRQAVFVPATPLPSAVNRTITITLSFSGGTVAQALGRFRLSVTGSPDPLRVVAISPKTRQTLAVPAAKRSSEQRDAVRRAFRSKSPAFASTRDAIADLEKQVERLGIVSAQVLQERASFDRPSTFFRERGSFLAKGERVYAATPEVLPPLPDDAMPNRLGLARWLVSESNPLTARVTVNRAWEQFFGRGLVETSEDFGTQNSPPSHPELLDWLATELVRDKWHLKSLHRLIVTSATYRQSAAATPALLERDPYNRLLARGPRFRLDAEAIRDTVLAASGLLSAKIGGPSVFPVQPDGIWDNPYSDAEWVTSTGEDRHRRGLYTFIRRTSPYPSLLTFDGTSREFCTVRRVRTNTPLQALVTLNDEVFFEAARALAARILHDVPGAADNDDVIRTRAALGFRLCTSRRPTEEETTRIAASYRRQLALVRAKAGSDAAITRVAADTPGLASHAAWTMIANALLNLDETVTK